MQSLIVQVENRDGILVTTSNRVAEELEVRHDSLLEKIDDYLKKFNLTGKKSPTSISGAMNCLIFF